MSLSLSWRTEEEEGWGGGGGPWVGAGVAEGIIKAEGAKGDILKSKSSTVSVVLASVKETRNKFRLNLPTDKPAYILQPARAAMETECQQEMVPRTCAVCSPDTNQPFHVGRKHKQSVY